MKGRAGLSALTVSLMLLVLAGLGAAIAGLAAGGAAPSVSARRGLAAWYAARAGVAWAAQMTENYTTADRERWLALAGTTLELAGTGGPRCTVSVNYSDPDGDSATADSVTVSVTGLPGVGGVESRTLRAVFTAPPPGEALLFEDHFEGAMAGFDQRYLAGASASAHGGIVPYTTGGTAPGGDVDGLFTLSEETGGSPSILVMGGEGEARFTLFSGECLKWSATPGADPCAYPECESRGECRAREGFKAPLDEEGYQNYFIKARVRLNFGSGYGIYFRSGYADENDPALIDFGSLSGYAWQYDAALGYLAPCDLASAVFGADGVGMLAARKIHGGSETCADECGVYASPSGGAYPFFCPENRTGLEQLSGWRWNNADWYAGWNVIYLYVYKGTAKIYVEREGLGAGPELAGTVDLGAIGTTRAAGSLGVRVFGGARIELDYLRVYGNDANHDPSTFAGAP